MENIDQILNEAKLLEQTDDFDRAVALFQKAFDIYAVRKDYDNALYVYTKALRILKREGEFYRVGTSHLKAAVIYKELNDNLNAARCFSRAGTAFLSVSAFSEAANAYFKAGESFFSLKGEFYVESGKHYKMSALNFLNQQEHEFVEYNKAYKKGMDSYKTAYDTKNISYNEYILYMTNFCDDVQGTLARNGFYREEKEFYIMKMDFMRQGCRIKPGGQWQYATMTIWKWTCKYGESPLLWAVWILANILIIGYLFYAFQLVKPPHGGNISFMESIFFSLDVFATLGFGSYMLISDLARLLAGIDVVMGLFMTAMLVTILARRITR